MAGVYLIVDGGTREAVRRIGLRRGGHPRSLGGVPPNAARRQTRAARRVARAGAQPPPRLQVLDATDAAQDTHRDRSGGGRVAAEAEAGSRALWSNSN